MTTRPPRLPQRLQHYDGEQLSAADLRDTLADQEHLLRIHEGNVHRGRRLGRPHLGIRQTTLEVPVGNLNVNADIVPLFPSMRLPFICSISHPWPAELVFVLVSFREISPAKLDFNVLVAASSPNNLARAFENRGRTLTVTWLGVENRRLSALLWSLASPRVAGAPMEEQALASAAATPERPAFFDGQQLLAADLNMLDGHARSLRWRHNRDMHDWGIAQGFAVQGQPGDRTVTVTPGYAIDGQGREILLAETRTLAVPAVADRADFHLCVSYAQDSELPAEQRIGPYGATGAVRRNEAPLLRWVQDASLIPGYHLVLSTVQVRNCRVATLSEALRRSALPERSPFIASGFTQTGALSWKPILDQQQVIGVQVIVSTVEAAFLSAPQYSAQILGRRAFGDGYIDGPIQILNPLPTSFTLRMLLPRNLFLGANGPMLNPQALLTPAAIDNLIADINRRWTIFWMGIEAG